MGILTKLLSRSEKTVAHLPLSSIGHEAPHIRTRNIAGVKTTLIGPDLHPDVAAHFMRQVQTMKEQYPGAHSRLGHIILDNTNTTEKMFHKENLFSSEESSFIDQARVRQGAVALTGVGQRPGEIRPNMSIVVNVQGILKRTQETGMENVENDGLAQIYTHEFGHVIQEHMARLSNEDRNIRITNEDRDISDKRMNKLIDKPFAKSGHSLLSEGANANPNSARTNWFLGSEYAGSAHAELYPELLRLVHYPNPINKSKGFAPSVKKGLDPRGFAISSVGKIKNQIQNLEKQTISGIRSTTKNGARPRSRSAIGGIGYLQSR